MKVNKIDQIIHDINNPLSYIKNNLNYLENELEKIKLNKQTQTDWKDLIQALRESLEGCEEIALQTEKLREIKN